MNAIDNVSRTIKYAREMFHVHFKEPESPAVTHMLESAESELRALQERVEAQQKMLKRLGFRNWWNNAREE